jgi:hypothetical protein
MSAHDPFEQGWDDACDILDKLPEENSEQHDYWVGYGTSLITALYPDFERPAWTTPIMSLRHWLAHR